MKTRVIIKRVIVKDSKGKKHGPIVTYVDGVMLPDDWKRIQEIKAH